MKGKRIMNLESFQFANAFREQRQLLTVFFLYIFLFIYIQRLLNSSALLYFMRFDLLFCSFLPLHLSVYWYVDDDFLSVLERNFAMRSLRKSYPCLCFENLYFPMPMSMLFLQIYTVGSCLVLFG